MLDWPIFDDLWEALGHWAHVRGVAEGDSRSLHVNTCLFVLEDAQRAIDAYSATDGFAGIGEAYLKKYGLLQAMQLQLDAVDALGRGLGKNLDINQYEGIRSVRDVRHTVGGHPIRSQTRGAKRQHFHDRITILEPGVIRFMSFAAADPTDWSGATLRVGDLVSSVRMAVQAALLDLISFLRAL